MPRRYVSSEISRERVLAAADRLFYARTFPATGMDRLAAESGVSLSVLYRLFVTKDALHLAYLRARADTWAEQLRARLPACATREDITAFFDVVVADTRRPNYLGCPLRRAVAQTDGDPAVAAVCQDSKRETLAALRRACRSAGIADAAEELMLLLEGLFVSARDDSAWASPATQMAVRRIVYG